MKKAGDKLYDLRKSHNLTQKKFGEMIGVTRQTILLWEANRREISLENIKRISNVFNLDLSYFLDNDGDNEESISSDNVSEIVACTEDSSEQNEKDVPYNEINSQQKDVKRSATNKKLIAIIVVALLVGIVSVIIGAFLTAPSDAFGTVAGVSVNFETNTIGWTVFIVAILIASIVTAILIIRNVKRREKDKIQK